MFSTRTESGYTIKVPFSFNGYTIVDEISKGSFSIVVKLIDEFSSRYFAAKIISKKDMEKQNMSKSIYNEIEIHRSVNHPNIVRFYEHFEIKNSKNEKFIVIVQEYCSKGCLLDYINENKGFSNEDEKKKVFFGLIQAIKLLHEKQIAHCDIKPENVLLDKDMTPKLCDFGLSKDFTKDHNESKCGSADYAAPELFKTGNVDFFKSDIWALGITMYATSELQFPFNDIYDVINGNLSIKTEDKRLKELIKKCTAMDPKKRPNVNDLLDDNFFLNDGDM